MCKEDQDVWKPLADFLGEMIVKYWDDLKESIDMSEESSGEIEVDLQQQRLDLQEVTKGKKRDENQL